MNTSKRRNRALRMLGVVALASTFAAATPPASAADDSSYKVLSFNAMMLTVPNYNNSGRAPLIAKAPWLGNNDFVAFQELFDNGASETLLSQVAAAYPYRTPVVGRTKSGWDATHGAWSDTTPEDGGTAIVSRWPIQAREQLIFKQACGADWLANKGIAYAKINVSGTSVHVVATHLQSQDSACAAGQAESARAAQWREITGFLDAKKIPASEQVIITGDLNVIRGTAEYDRMLAALNVKKPSAYLGHQYSFDPSRNGLTAARYPGTAPEQLDYVLYRNGHPGASPVNTRTDKSPSWQSGGKTYTDFSDHYPVTNY